MGNIQKPSNSGHTADVTNLHEPLVPSITVSLNPSTAQFIRPLYFRYNAAIFRSDINVPKGHYC
jgi:hypothetical protein